MSNIQNLKLDSATITSVEHLDSPSMTAPDGHVINKLPPRTIVKVVLNPAAGSNINVQIWLPDADKWNSRLLGIGNGGAAGNINPANLAWGAAAGYATATTDLGTAPNADSGINNREVWKDFGFRATHLMTVVAKQVITAFYGKGPEFSYFNGGSTGGQQGLQEAQRYPEDYDGIFTGIPAHCRTPLHAYFLWTDQILRKRPFTSAQEDSVIAAANEYLAPRGVPAAAGKFVSDSRATPEDIEAVIALALKKDASLTPEHAEALRKLFDGPHHAVTGERIFNGVPLGSHFGGARGNLYLWNWVFGKTKNLADINFGADMDTYTAALGPYLNAENPDLTAFQKRGGKILMSSGSVDAVVPPHATIDYYERVIQRCGGLEQTQGFFRFYLVPGMAHGGGPGVGLSVNTVETLRAWREKGIAPNALTGKRVVDGKTVLEMPLYPYPLKTGWDAEKSAYVPVEGPRGGVETVSPRFLPTPSD